MLGAILGDIVPNYTGISENFQRLLDAEKDGNPDVIFARILTLYRDIMSRHDLSEYNKLMPIMQKYGIDVDQLDEILGMM